MNKFLTGLDSVQSDVEGRIMLYAKTMANGDVYAETSQMNTLRPPFQKAAQSKLVMGEVVLYQCRKGHPIFAYCRDARRLRAYKIPTDYMVVNEIGKWVEYR